MKFVKKIKIGGGFFIGGGGGGGACPLVRVRSDAVYSIRLRIGVASLPWSPTTTTRIDRRRRRRLIDGLANYLSRHRTYHPKPSSRPARPHALFI